MATSLDSSAWQTELPEHPNLPRSFGSAQMQYYADRNSYTEDGCLVLHTRQEAMGGQVFTAGRVLSTRAFLYGRFEFRFNPPIIQGYGPAIWLLPFKNTWPPEVDIFEVFGNEAQFSLHWLDAANAPQLSSFRKTIAPGWHTVILEWSPDWLQWQLDDERIGALHSHIPQEPMYLIMNTSIGGSHKDPQPPFVDTFFRIDYFRHYRSQSWPTP